MYVKKFQGFPPPNFTRMKFVFRLVTSLKSFRFLGRPSHPKKACLFLSLNPGYLFDLVWWVYTGEDIVWDFWDQTSLNPAVVELVR